MAKDGERKPGNHPKECVQVCNWAEMSAVARQDMRQRALASAYWGRARWLKWVKVRITLTVWSADRLLSCFFKALSASWSASRRNRHGQMAHLFHQVPGGHAFLLASQVGQQAPRSRT